MNKKNSCPNLWLVLFFLDSVNRFSATLVFYAINTKGNEAFPSRQWTAGYRLHPLSKKGQVVTVFPAGCDHSTPHPSPESTPASDKRCSCCSLKQSWWICSDSALTKEEQGELSRTNSKDLPTSTNIWNPHRQNKVSASFSFIKGFLRNFTVQSVISLPCQRKQSVAASSRWLLTSSHIPDQHKIIHIQTKPKLEVCLDTHPPSGSNYKHLIPTGRGKTADKQSQNLHNSNDEFKHHSMTRGGWLQGENDWLVQEIPVKIQSHQN